MITLWGIELKAPATGESGWGDEMVNNLELLTTLVQPIVLDKDLSTPPGGSAAGDKYIVGGTATGAWAGHENDIAIYTGTSWIFYTPDKGWRFYVDDESIDYRFNGTSWTALS